MSKWSLTGDKSLDCGIAGFCLGAAFVLAVNYGVQSIAPYLEDDVGIPVKVQTGKDVQRGFVKPAALHAQVNEVFQVLRPHDIEVKTKSLNNDGDIVEGVFIFDSPDVD